MQKHEPIGDIFKQWEKQQVIIGEFFKRREKNLASEPMSECLILFLQALLLGNGKELNLLTNWKEEVNGLKIKPVNAIERLSYINNAPNHYHSFIQLQQLFEEFHKSYKIAKLKM